MAGVDEALNDAERRELRGKARAALLTTLRAFGGEALRRPLLEGARESGGFTARELAAPAPPKAKQKAIVRDAVLRLSLAAGLVVGLLGMLER